MNETQNQVRDEGESPGERAVRETERRFRAIYEQAPLGITLVDINTGRFVQCNPKFCEIVKRPPEEILALNFQTLTHPDDLAETLRNMALLRQGNRRSFNMEKRYLCPDGTAVWVSLTMVPMWVKGESPDFYMSLMEDITGRKQAEATQRRQADFDRLITKTLAWFASCTGPEIDEHIQSNLQEMGVFTGAETAFIVLFSQDFATWSVAYEWDAPGAPHLIQKYERVPVGTHPWSEQRLLSGEVVEIRTLDDFPPEAELNRALNQEDGVKSALLVPLRGRGEQVTGCIGLRTYSQAMTWSSEDIRRLRIEADAIANVLERKRVENDLHESRQMLQQILDTIPQRVFWKDKESNYVGCNKPFAEDAGLPDVNAVAGKSDHDLVWRGENAELFRADDRSVIESGTAKIGYEETQERIDGTIAWVRTSKMPLRDHQNKIFGVLGTYEDITALRQTREALERAKEAAEAANRAKDQFIAVLSHELRTPLTPVLATVSAMEGQERLSSALRADLDVIHRNVELEARLIDDLLDATRISHGKIDLRSELVDAHACIRSALDICGSEIETKRLEIELRLKAGEPHVWADPARLRQIFWNLLQNAVKFTPPRGQVCVCTSNRDGRLKIEIADNGIGIESEAMGRIFNPFEQGEQTWTRRFGGLGLGLSITKNLVELHQGSITAQSEGKNSGTLFTVELPSVTAAPQLAGPVEAAGPGTPQLKRILLVEDHADTLRIFARLLRRSGYGVTTADSVQSALARASEQPVDLLISDLGLPDGSGQEIMKTVKSRYSLQGIALSGYGTDEDIRASLEAGFDEHLTKPVNFQTLQAAIQRLAAKASQTH